MSMMNYFCVKLFNIRSPTELNSAMLRKEREVHAELSRSFMVYVETMISCVYPILPVLVLCAGFSRRLI
jgi:hypothetical protein